MPHPSPELCSTQVPHPRPIPRRPIPMGFQLALSKQNAGDPQRRRRSSSSLAPEDLAPATRKKEGRFIGMFFVFS